MNVIQNKLSITGPSAGQVLARIANGKHRIDFNKVYTPPDRLNIEWSMLGCAGYYIETGENISDTHGTGEMKAYVESLNQMQKETARKLARQYLDNLKNVRFQTAHQWRKAAWGNPWNAFKTPDIRDTKNTIYFQTCELVPTIVARLADMYSKVDISYSWANMGGKAGGERFREGRRIGTLRIPQNSKEFYRLYVELWGEDMKQFFWKSGDKYIRMA